MIQTEVTNGDMMIGVLRNIVYNKHEEERVREVARIHPTKADREDASLNDAL